LIRRLYRYVLAEIYDPFLEPLERTLKAHRLDLLSRTYGDVLEVGAGTGVNFALYPEGVNVYAVEPSEAMIRKARKKLRPGIRLIHGGIEDVPRLTGLPRQFDFIVSTLVMCTVKDPYETARIYKRLLKPGGRLLVLEHIHSTGRPYGMLQKWINPLWRPLADGCNLTRRQDLILKQAGFKPESETYFRTGTDWYKAVMLKED